MSSSPDDLHDGALWRALAHAPDQAAAPDWRVRKAILREAHEAVGVSDGARPAVETKPWWRRLFGRSEGASRMPWNAAFATLLVGVLVTMLWQREPVPGPQLDGAPALPAAPAQKPAPVAPSEAPRAAEPAPLPSLPAPEPPAATAPAPPEPQAAPAQPRRESRAAAPASEVAPPRPLAEATPADAAGAAAPAAPPPAAPRAAVPAPTPSPPSSALAESPAADAAARFSAPSAPASRGREAAEREAPKRAAAPAVRTDATEPPTFAALSQWTRLTITERGGASRSMARADGRDLNALLGSAALSAVGPRPLAAAPEWRVTLERGREVLAVFEIARDQVRWREGDTPAGTGTPSAPALAALREALREAVQPPPAEAAPAAPAEPRN